VYVAVDTDMPLNPRLFIH